MAVISRIASILISMFPFLPSPVVTGSLADIDHVVLFMQENRAFDHYFGTMAGVRGFSDPNVQISNFKPVWQQAVNSNLTTNASYLLPWYLNYEGGDFLEATQCMVAGDNGWASNHAALNGGLNDHWATDNTPWSWGHFKRDDIPIQFGIAEGWTVGDMYQESIIASTNPNRVTWVSGSINVPGSPQTANQGGNPYIDNNETPGCESGGFNCYPLSWITTAEYYQNADISWSIFQDVDNFDDNPLAWFAQFQNAPTSSRLYKQGMLGQSLDDFYARAANGTLPAVSYIIGPTQLSEHPPYAPRDGAWLQKKIVDTVTSSSAYPHTALIVSYDETGGFGDHVVPYHSPPGTPGEWINDPYNEVGYTYSGPGFRLPFYIISPWTRGGTVFTEHADHNSQILFIEKWLAAKGKNVKTNEMVAWRRQHMSDLTNAFDFSNADFSLATLPDAPEPHKDENGDYDGSSVCESLYAVTRPDVPYTNQIAPNNVSSLSEQGFKGVRGTLTEGRYLVFEINGFALSNGGSSGLNGTKATRDHSNITQRWIIHSLVDGGNTFTISSAKDEKYLGFTGLNSGSIGAEIYTVTFAAGQGHALQNTNGQYLTIDNSGKVQTSTGITYFKTFSVTYSS